MISPEAPFWLHDARAVAEALFATDQGPPPAARLDWLIADLEGFVQESGPRVRTILVAGLTLATWVAPPMVGRAPPLSRLSIPERCRALEEFEKSKLGLPMLGVKAMLCILYYEHPDVLREVGVIGPDETHPGCLRSGPSGEGGAA